MFFTVLNSDVNYHFGGNTRITRMTRKMKHQHVSKICFCLLATSVHDHTTIPVKSRLLTAMPTMLKRMKTIMQISSLLSAIPGPFDFNCSDTALRTAQYVI